MVALTQANWSTLTHSHAAESHAGHGCTCGADSGVLIAEPFVEVNYDTPRRSFYDVRELPAVMTACAFSGNDDAAADQAYHAINMWMAARGFSLAGPKREIHLDDMLEIQFPLRSERQTDAVRDCLR